MLFDKALGLQVFSILFDDTGSAAILKWSTVEPVMFHSSIPFNERSVGRAFCAKVDASFTILDKEKSRSSFAPRALISVPFCKTNVFPRNTLTNINVLRII